MEHCGAQLAHHVVAGARQPSALKGLLPFRSRRNENRNRVDKPAASVKGRFCIVLRPSPAADWQVTEQHLGSRVLEHFHDVNGRASGYPHFLRQVAPNAVVHLALHHFYAGLVYVIDYPDSVVWLGKDCLREVLAYFCVCDVKRCHELDV